MAKRFIDTGFLDQKWIRKLSPERKIFIIYLMLRCDNGGVIDLDIEDAEFWIGKKLGDPQKFLPVGFLIHVSDDKYFMPKFLKWQYPNFPHSKVHQQKQAISILTSLQIFDTETNSISNNYLNVTQTLPNIGAIVNDNGNVDDNEIELFPFDKFWDLYNKRVGSKEKCEKKWNSLIDDDKVRILTTLPNWLRQFKDKQFQPYPETYLNNKRWDDVLEFQSTWDVKKEDQSNFENL